MTASKWNKILKQIINKPAKAAKDTKHTKHKHISSQLWDEDENKLIEQRRARDAAFRQEMRELVGRADTATVFRATKKRAGCFSMIGLFAIPVVAIGLAQVLLGEMT